MKKMGIKTYLSIILIFVTTIGSSQIDYRLVYHPQINNAELAVVEENYRLALEYYKRAFKFFDIGFGRDYHNAALCAIELKDYHQAIKYLEVLIAKGVDKRFFEENTDRYGKLLINGFDKFLIEYDDIRSKTFQNTQNNYLIGTFGEMVNRDQEFRGNYKSFQDTIKKIDKENITKFVELIDKHGFPSEEMLGLQNGPYSDENYYHFIVWHHMKNWKADNSIVDIRFILLDAVKNGKLSPEQAAEYLNLSESKIGRIGNYGSTGIIKFHGDSRIYILINNEKEKERINKNRKEIGLYSLQDFERKVKYHFTQKNNSSIFEMLKLDGPTTYPEDAKNFIDVQRVK